MNHKKVYDILTENIKLNNCDNVTTFNFGASDKDDIFYMNVVYDRPENQGAFRICNENSKIKNQLLKIECKPIDSLNLENIGYIKIDVEGHELQCIKGMVNTIKKYNPVIAIEIHDKCPSKNDTLQLLYDLNYKNYLKMTHCDYLFVNQWF